LGGASSGDVIIDIERSFFLLASQIPVSALQEEKRFVAGKSYTKRGVSLVDGRTVHSHDGNCDHLKYPAIIKGHLFPSYEHVV
jgi:hypothetical protein